MNKSLRDSITAELKQTVIPLLRTLGFTGSFPTFRRISDLRIDMIHFRFSSWKDSTIIDCFRAPKTAFSASGQAPPNFAKLTNLDVAGACRPGPGEAIGHVINVNPNVSPRPADVINETIQFLQDFATPFWEGGRASLPTTQDFAEDKEEMH